MQEQKVETLIEQNPFFKGLSPKYIKILAQYTASDHFEAGEFVFKEGEIAEQFYIIQEGLVSLELNSPQHGAVTIQSLGRGEILGWSWFFPPYRRHYDAIATEDTRALSLNGKILRGHCEKDHDFGYELLKRFSHVIVERLQATRLQLLG